MINLLKSLFPYGFETPQKRLAARKTGKYVPSLTPYSHLKFGDSLIGKCERGGLYIPLSQVKHYWTSNPKDKLGDSLKNCADFFDSRINRDCLNTYGYYLDAYQDAAQAFGIAKLGSDLYMPCLPDAYGNAGMTVFPKEYFHKVDAKNLHEYVESARHEAELYAEQCREAEAEQYRIERVESLKAELVENFAEARAWCRHHKQIPGVLRAEEYPANLLEQKLCALKLTRRSLRKQILETLEELPIEVQKIHKFGLGRGE